MSKFLVKTLLGTKQPTFVHETFDDAFREAKRLFHIHKCTTQILEIVGELTYEEVEIPVTRIEIQQKITVDSRFEPIDNLPF